MKIKVGLIAFLSLILVCLLYGQNIKTPPAPNYSELKYWAAHPDKDSPALAVPGKGSINSDELYDVDVFYIHPTSYTGKDRKGWNADLRNSYLNDKTDSYVIKNQASIFNQVGLIYAPRYRQAFIGAYSLPEGENRNLIFNTAYSDVKDAFLHYLKYFNEGKPFILATHSQGTTHGKRLMKEVIEVDPQLLDKLVVAYLVGMDVKQNEFEKVKPCNKPNETGCFTAWRTIRKDSPPPSYYPTGNEYVATNPLTWDVEKTKATKKAHMGAILKRFNKVHTHALNSEVKDGILYVCKPKFPFSFLLKWTNYHIVDYNLFYYNVQSNARLRAASYLQRVGMNN
tara:strand:+ start:113 stop:1132 length:1020 start_codon:yes stop_codon:yes gene_type:complete